MTVAGRKPKTDVPTPDEFLSVYPKDMRALANQLRGLVRKALPDAIEKVILGWQCLGYRLPHNGKTVYFAFIIPHPDSVTLGFEWGALFTDPPGILLGEELKQVRWIKIESQKDVQPELFSSLLREAAEVAVLPRRMKMDMLRR